MTVIRKFARGCMPLLCALLLLGGGALRAAAVSFNSGLPALRGQWARAEGPAADGLRLEYSYYAPAAQTPCPLVVLLGGAGEGTPSGKELEANDFAYWSSEEYQARVPDAQGMYLLILKAPEPVYFDTCPVAPMIAAIEAFVASHPVDQKRIYVGGWCLGASGAAKLAVRYPNFFAGLMLFSPRTLLTASEAETIKRMKVWIFGCIGDTYSNYAAFAAPSWEHVSAAATDKANVRFTSCTLAPRAALILNHKTWRLAEQDFAPNVQQDYTGLKTVDGNGREIAAPTVISFLTAYRAGEAPPTTAPEITTEPATAATAANTTVPVTTAQMATQTPSEGAQTITAQSRIPATDGTTAPVQPVAGHRRAPLVIGLAASAAGIWTAALLLLRKRRKL